MIGIGGYNPHKQTLFENSIIFRVQMGPKIKEFEDHEDNGIVTEQ